MLLDISNVRSDTRTKFRNQKALKERLTEIMDKRHEVVARRIDEERGKVKGGWRAMSLGWLQEKVTDIRQVSLGKMLVSCGSTAKFVKSV